MANDDPAEFLGDYGWLAEGCGPWTLVHQGCLVGICDVDGGRPRSLFEACIVGALDGSIEPVGFPTVAGAVRWVARNTVGGLRERGGQQVGDWETR